MRRNRPITCADGFRLSIQANASAYCTPRENLGTYTEVECGFPSEPEPFLMDYADDPDYPCGTIYSYVPVSVVSLVIAKHGGIISGDVPKGVPRLIAQKTI